MPVAAVPRYLGHNFDSASPGLRFGLFLPVWTERSDQERQVRGRAARRSREGSEVKLILEQQGMDAAIRFLLQRDRNRLPALWEKDDSGARAAWSKVSSLNAPDKTRMQKLAARQQALGDLVGAAALLRFEAKSISPFTTGLGNEHPLENGFSFLNPYGLPYLPGSGVKGVVRRAAEELASGDWGDSRGWSAERQYSVSLSSNGMPSEDEKRIPLSMFDVLFGKETEGGEKEHFRGVLAFWDVIPLIAGDKLLVEIMTPHASHYYQQRPAAGSTSPHDSGQPTPIQFLTVPPGSTFTFHVACDTARLVRVAPELAENGRWKKLIEAAFEHAFQWLGFGAKTAVGYGAMERKKLPAPGSGSTGQCQETARIPPAGPAPQPAARIVWQRATLKRNPATKEISARYQNKTALLPSNRVEEFMRQLGAEREDTLKKKNSLADVDVFVEQDGNKYTLVGLAPAG